MLQILLAGGSCVEGVVSVSCVTELRYASLFPATLGACDSGCVDPVLHRLAL